MRSRVIRYIAVFCIVAAFLSLVIVPAAATSGTVQHETVDVVVHRATISIFVSPEPQNTVVNNAAENLTGDKGVVQGRVLANQTTEIVITRNITNAEPRAAGLPVTLRPGQLVNINYSVIIPSATGDSPVGEPGDTSNTSGLTGSNHVGTSGRLPTEFLSLILKKLNEEKNALTCIFTGC
jgi:hypothetical protein